MEPSDRQPQTVDVIRLSGVLGVGSGRFALHEEIQTRVRAGQTLFVLEMSGLEHVDSMGISMLVAAHTTVARAGGRLILARIASRVERVLTVTHLLTIFEHCATEADALALLNERRQPAVASSHDGA